MGGNKMALFEQIGKKITVASQGVVKQTRNLTDTTRLNAKISENKNKMSQLLFEMGNDYYKKHRKDQDCEEQEYIDQINALFIEILNYQKEIEEIKTAESCPACGARIAEDAAFCMKCGTKLSPEEIEEESNEPSRKCPSCGEVVDDDNVFCIYCGTKISDNADDFSDDSEEQIEDEPMRICPECGAEAENDDVFCMICGAKL